MEDILSRGSIMSILLINFNRKGSVFGPITYFSPIPFIYGSFGTRSLQNDMVDQLGVPISFNTLIN